MADLDLREQPESLSEPHYERFRVVGGWSATLTLGISSRLLVIRSERHANPAQSSHVHN
jgi:hypothetical protein